MPYGITGLERVKTLFTWALSVPVPLSWNLGTLTSWNPLGQPRPVMGLLYLYCPLSELDLCLLRRFRSRLYSRVLVLLFLGAKRRRVLLEKLTDPHLVKKILHILWNPKVPYRIHKRLPPTAFLSQINPVDANPRIPWRSVLVLHVPPTSRSSRWSLSIRYPNQNPLYTSPIPHTCYITRPSRISWFDHRIYLVRSTDHKLFVL